MTPSFLSALRVFISRFDGNLKGLVILNIIRLSLHKKSPPLPLLICQRLAWCSNLIVALPVCEWLLLPLVYVD